jgi:amphi-Trp domain-containing protein
MPIVVPTATREEAEKKPEEEKTEEEKKSKEVEVEYPLKFVEAAAFLRELADTLEKGGKVEIDLAQRQIQLNPDEPVTLEITYKEDAKKKKLEVELEIKEHFGASGKEGGRPTVR